MDGQLPVDLAERRVAGKVSEPFLEAAVGADLRGVLILIHRRRRRERSRLLPRARESRPLRRRRRKRSRLMPRTRKGRPLLTGRLPHWSAESLPPPG